jgi:alkylation response protein AidB-like acyl-CoA dehydrogenase
VSVDEARAFREEVRSWLLANRPEPPSFTLPQSFLEVQSEAQFNYLRDWQRKVFDAGFLGWDVPVAYGGRGVDLAKHVIVKRELVAMRAPFMVNTIGLSWVVPTILEHGTEAQKTKLVGKILSADHIWCQGFSEPSAGSDLASLSTRAEKQPDGSYRVSGHKVWTTIAHFADYMILLARTDPEDNKYAGLSYFLFEMSDSGVDIQPLTKMSGEGGFNQVIFDAAPMQADALLGEEGQGWPIAMSTLTYERGAAGVSGEAAAASAALLGRVVELAREVPELATSQRDRLVDLWVAVEAARYGELRGRVKELVAERPLALPMMSKLLRSEIDQRLAALGCELIGSDLALASGDPDAPSDGWWPRRYMNSFGFTIGGGTSEIQRNLLAERVLGLPRSR